MTLYITYIQLNCHHSSTNEFFGGFRRVNKQTNKLWLRGRPLLPTHPLAADALLPASGGPNPKPTQF